MQAVFVVFPPFLSLLLVALEAEVTCCLGLLALLGASLAILGKVRFFLRGRAGEFWYFFQKKVLALPHVLIKKLLTPHF